MTFIDHYYTPGVAAWGGGPAEGHESPLRRAGGQPGHVHWPPLLPAGHPRLQVQNTGQLINKYRENECKNMLQALHVMFTLFAAFKNSEHFAQYGEESEI